MAETQTKRLERIEEKIDRITECVNDLSKHHAVMENRTKDLEVRRQESYERANKFSEKLDHVHDCMHDVRSKTELSHRLIWGVGGVVVVALVNEFFNFI